ncbi:uncharacterized protein K452DRAFT_236786 [Aplosporella prunicola CBS 121167]|uniref:Uncharacterized protein n=1 Tax=Aplosporella prunicola CBS 121167 TaxID=1176127 RepID=A0A6A6AYP5_9PEZI|nr:uncharacterized protein K452DRAFT_236786 [Aplosporella prunicola CBS 121167]KAF2136900.1 hypothetical protein K452DRAFT_236786 [Aplosporella prunicola CBS 121167]
MASIGKLVNALVHGSQEATLALANINFDFSLVKLEAPAEFHGLGAALTQRRKAVAETGASHVTARKLGALFDSCLPSTPKLIQAYGNRVSEVAKDPRFGSEATAAKGIFADYVGIDGTSIWAAATSGSTSIAVHLLACILARLWTTSEATSIWVELVQERKKELGDLNSSEPLHLSTLTAAHIDISRDHLAEWDNSARAWLRAADEAKSLQQKQLTLIVENLTVPISSHKTGTYKSVLHVWKNALRLMENVLCGMPQAVEDGALLLGLACWHIYPDLNLHGNLKVEQHDNLVPKGVFITVGLETSPAQHVGGVIWSLPLAHYRYYGSPKSSTRTLCNDTERVSFEGFLQVALGAYLHNWPDALAKLEEYAQFLVEFSAYLDVLGDETFSQTKDCSAGESPQRNDWLQVLAQASQKLLDSKGVDRAMCLRLAKLGQRRAKDLLGRTLPMFGLTEMEILLSLLSHREDKIALLRRIASRLASKTNAGPNDIYISYDAPRLEQFTAAWGNIEAEGYELEETRGPVPVYLTAIPILEPTKKRNNSGTVLSNSYHQRWIAPIHATHRMEATKHFEDVQKKRNERTSSDPTEEYIIDQTAPIGLQSIGPDRFAITSGTNGLDLFISPQIQENMEPSRLKAQKEDISWALSTNALDVQKLVRYISLESQFSNEVGLSLEWSGLEWDEEYHNSMRSLSTIASIYKNFENATVALKGISRPLSSLYWHKSCVEKEDDDPFTRPSPSGFSAFKLTRKEAFALLISMETGEVNLRPESLDHVMAMSSGDSLFVSRLILSDPEEVPDKTKPIIQRIRGNIGKAGIAMLVSPSDPLIKSVGSSDWRLINHNQFDGCLTDSFSDTSLHLSFTDYKMPIDTGVYGSRDAEIFLMEAIVSVHDRGAWIADLDIIKASEKLYHALEQPWHINRTCEHDNGYHNRRLNAIAIDNWDEFLDKPESLCIVRAWGNWVARLSAATISAQRSDKHCRTVIVPRSEKICWECIMQFADNEQGVLIC